MKLGVDPIELLRMVKGNVVPTEEARSGGWRGSPHSDIRYLKLVQQSRKDLSGAAN